MEITSHKKVAVHPLPSYHTNHSSETKHAGHCWRSKDELISDGLQWKSAHEHASVGRPAKTYIDQLCADTGCCTEDLPRMMSDRDGWREIVMDIRANSLN